MKRIIIFFILLPIFILPVSATGSDSYKEQLELSGFDNVEESLPEQAQKFFTQNTIDPYDENWTSKITTNTILDEIISFIESGGKKPLKAFAEILAVLILFAAAQSFSDDSQGIKTSLNYIFSAIICLTVTVPILGVINAAASAIKGTSVFMLSFIPVYAGILTAGGSAAKAAGMSSLLLTAAEGAVQLTAFVIVPFMSAYLALGIASGVSPLVKDSGICETLKKIAMWIMSLMFTVFVGLLSIQTTISATADSVGIRTLKFMVGSFVPVAGTALSEALTTVTGSMKMIQGTVGIYAILAVALGVLPIIIELLLWRLTIMLSSLASAVLSIPRVPSVLKAIDSTIAVIIGVVLFISALFVISLGVVLGAGGV